MYALRAHDSCVVFHQVRAHRVTWYLLMILFMLASTSWCASKWKLMILQIKMLEIVLILCFFVHHLMSEYRNHRRGAV